MSENQRKVVTDLVVLVVAGLAVLAIWHLVFGM